jgi:hypothetical protein
MVNCYNAECRLCQVTLMINVVIAVYPECQYAQCHYTECCVIIKDEENVKILILEVLGPAEG